ncbi:MAG: hypothetical protein A7316_04930 [Candidatus Altiarchaeales archaeon WOR_SM1_86-2]|nr:MAG: hypothetical protein A7316_04930 [Candidatus Altiarchaeales archaeon WOR_SM1_86-2]
MGIIDAIRDALSTKEKREELEKLDLEDIIDNPQYGRISEEDLTYVQPVDLNAEADIVNALTELKRGNLVVLNIKPVMSNKALRNAAVQKLRDECVDKLGGDISMISHEKILVVPKGMRIVARGG